MRNNKPVIFSTWGYSYVPPSDLKKDEIKQDSGSSIPYKFVVKSVDGKFRVTDSKIPRDGSYYSVDMKNIFPDSVRNDMNEVHNDGTIEKLEMDIQKQLNLYFHR